MSWRMKLLELPSPPPSAMDTIISASYFYHRTSFLICGLLVALASFLSFLLLFLKEGHGDSLVLLPHLSIPSFRKLPPSCLLAFRALAFLYLLAILSRNIVLSGVFVFYFYTQWTFTLLLIYFGIAFIFSARETACSKFTSSSNENALPGSRVGVGRESTVDVEKPKTDVATLPKTTYPEPVEQVAFAGFMMQIIFQTVAGAVLLTDMVYWLFLFPLNWENPRSHDFLEINLHGVNLVFLLVDTLLNRMRFPWFRCAYFTLWCIVYIIFQWAVHFFLPEDRWPYPFLDPSTKWSPLWYVVLYVAHIICYGIICFIVYLRDRLARFGA